MARRWLSSFKNLCLVPVVLLGSLPAAAEPLALTVERNALVATGATPQGRVIFFGVAREIAPDDVVEVTSRTETLVDEDGDGRVAFQLRTAVAPRSAWAAVDLANGSFAAAAPEGFPLRRVGFNGQGLGRRPDGRDSLVDRRALVEVLVVRPRIGAWVLRLGDGGPGDGDGAANGRLEAVLETLEPLAGSPPPPRTFEKDDVVILLDPQLLEMTLVRVDTLTPGPSPRGEG